MVERKGTFISEVTEVAAVCVRILLDFVQGITNISFFLLRYTCFQH